MTNVKNVGGPPLPSAAQQAAAGEQAKQSSMQGDRPDGVHTGRHREAKQHHAAGKQARESPLAEFQRPHRVHTSRERNAALQRKHAAELLDEAARHAINELASNQIQSQSEIKEENQKLKGINFDEERKKKGRRQDQGEQSNSDQDQTDSESAEAAAAKALGGKDGTGKYFQDLPEDRMGDLTLSNPNEMKRLLGPSVRFAQHAMLLAEAKVKEGMPREQALEFLASIYLGLADREYARKALKEFGPATGIIDLYPLELMKHLLEHVPSFMSKVSAAKFLTAQPTGGYKGETGKPIVLKYDPELRIRGFAIKGGEKPGYVFEPVDPPGTYHLTFANPGKFRVLLSALSKAAQVSIEEFDVEITKGAEDLEFEASAALKKARASTEDVDGASSQAPAAQLAQPALDGAQPAPGAPQAAESEPPKKKKKDDLKIVIPRKI